jgi:hypothetical protein
MTALGASLHMYWMASWSPSQSLPLIVSYACQRQSSSVMLPSAALMPPWAATVCERVGNSFVMHLRPGEASLLGLAGVAGTAGAATADEKS